MNFRFFVLLITFFYSSGILAQIINGQILDAQTKEPIPFANIHQKGFIQNGTTSNDQGFFSLKLSNNSDSIIISYIGYQTKSFTIKAAKPPFQVFLSEKKVELKSAEVKVERDPLRSLIKRIASAKSKNDSKKAPYFEADVYRKFEVDMAEVSRKLSEWWLIRPFRYFFTNVDTSYESKPLIPLFLRETSSRMYSRKKPAKQSDIIKHTHFAGFEVDQAVATIEARQNNLNFYENLMVVFDQNFTSPIADNSWDFYKYSIPDTLTIDGRRTFHILFKPKRKGEYTFTGEMLIDSTDLAIRSIQVRPSGKETFNLIQNFMFKVDFEKIEDSLWLPKREENRILYIDLTDPILATVSKQIRDKAPNLASKNIVIYNNYSFTPTLNMDTLPLFSDDKKKEIKDTLFWRNERAEELTYNEYMLEGMMDSLNRTVAAKALRIGASLLFAGQARLGPISVGNLYNFYQHNQREGHRFTLNVKTSAQLSRDFAAGLFLAYGTGDKRFKYGANFTYIISRRPRIQLDVSFRNDFINSRRAYSAQQSQGILDANIRRREGGKIIPQKLSFHREFNASYLHEWSSGFSLRFSGNDKLEQPLFHYRYVNSFGEESNKEIKSNEFAIQARFAFKEEFFAGNFTRISLGSKIPVFSLRYGLGLLQERLRTKLFHRIDFTAQHRTRIPVLGTMNLTYNTGYIHGRVPYLLLYIPKGNEGWFYIPEGFNLLKEYEFAVNHYQVFILDHHFNGLLFNRIPGVKKLKFKEVFSYRMFWGTLNKENRDANRFNYIENTSINDEVRLKDIGSVPYMEMSAGIENIFRFFRIDAVWRVTHLSKIKDANVGVRFYFQARF